jgi:hypothetical protein
VQRSALMRHTAVLGLLAAAGCNQIWGLGRVDLEPPNDGLPGGTPRIRLTTQIAKTNASGMVDMELDYGPIAPAPEVLLGLLGETLESAEYGPDGIVPYPTDLVGKPWRLVYKLADGIPHEVRWSPPAGTVGHIVDPRFGRLERLPVPPGSGYKIAPVGSPAQHALTRVFTTGLWTEGVVTGAIPAGAALDYDFSTKAVSLGGPLGAPEKARADHGVLVDFKNQNSCRVATGTATFAVPDLVAGTMTAPEVQPEYISADKNVRLTLGGPALIDVRLQTLLGARAGGAADVLRMEYGYTPSLGVFGFSRPPSSPSDFYLPGPLVIALANCTIPQGSTFFQSETFADALDLTPLFSRAVHLEVVNQRMLGSLVLSSGFAAVLTSNDLNFTSDFAVAAPIRIRLLRGGTQVADLEAAADGATLPAGGEPLELVFDLESDPGLASDSFDISVYAIQGANLKLQQIYTTTDRELTLDPAALLPDTEYVFEIRAYRGRPNAARGDFAANTYPQYAASIFTRSFKTPP